MWLLQLKIFDFGPDFPENCCESSLDAWTWPQNTSLKSSYDEPPLVGFNSQMAGNFLHPCTAARMTSQPLPQPSPVQQVFHFAVTPLPCRGVTLLTLMLLKHLIFVSRQCTPSWWTFHHMDLIILSIFPHCCGSCALFLPPALCSIQWLSDSHSSFSSTSFIPKDNCRLS